MSLFDDDKRRLRQRNRYSTCDVSTTDTDNVTGDDDRRRDYTAPSGLCQPLQPLSDAANSLHSPPLYVEPVASISMKCHSTRSSAVAEKPRDASRH